MFHNIPYANRAKLCAKAAVGASRVLGPQSL